MPLILRSTKGSPLTHAELDGNFSFLTGSVSASYAVSASHAGRAITASFVTSASFAQTSSIAFYSYYSNQSTYSAQAVYATSAGNATTALNATTASYAVSSSVAALSSFATTASYAINVPTINTGSFAVTGSNIFIGNQTITGATTIKAPDGSTSLIVSSSYSSSISSSNNTITPTFNGTLSLTGVNPGSPLGFTFNSDIWINYSAVSSSQHTQASSTLKKVADGVIYDSLNIGLSNGITLSPVGTIDNENYTIWIKDVASNQFYKKDNQSLSFLQTFGLNIPLNGNTDTNLSTDLVNFGFSLTTDPVTNYLNTLTYASQSLLPFTSSLVTINSPLTINSVSGSRIYPTSSGVPTFSGSDGQFVFGTTGGNHYIYTWMSNKWRSGSLL
jgi:hypothetical protein